MTSKEQIKKLIDDHKIKLAQVQQQFQEICKAMSESSKVKINATPKEQTAELQKIIDDYQ